MMLQPVYDIMQAQASHRIVSLNELAERLLRAGFKDDAEMYFACRDAVVEYLKDLDDRYRNASSQSVCT